MSIFGNFGGGNAGASNTTGGGLFGASSTNTNPQQSQSTQQSIFGSTNTNTNTAGGAFGTNTNTAGNTGGSIFGGGNAATNNQPGTTTGGGLFGNQTAPATGASLFSTTTNPSGAANTNTGSIFGTNTTTQQNHCLAELRTPLPPHRREIYSQQPSLFGSAGGNPLFGGNKSTLQSNPSLTASSLGPPNNMLGSRSTTGTQGYPSDAHAQFAKTAASIEAIYNAWNPASKDCRFQAYFYNLVNPKDAQSYGRPPNVTNDAIWEKANRENPDPTCFVPSIAIGFDDLRARANSQSEKITDLRSRLAALRTEHEVSNSSRLLRAAVAQMQIAQRIMRFVQHLHLLIPSVRSSALRPEEEKLRGMLEELEEELRRERVKSRLNELWALIGAVGASVDRAGGGGAAGSAGPSEWAVVDEEGLAQIAQILAEQQAGLQHLTRILQKDQKDLSMILGNASSTKDTSGDDLSLPTSTDENLWGSTSTLRASALR
ncbi:nucleoporin complex subunit 54-domain-containing protein [Pholiota molesta]|nr:nucleoporin complex subunit 54-domain-containing protein [Pholiota molesta]